MNAVLGTGLGNGGASTGTATPYSYDDTPTDFMLDSSHATQIGALNDGTQIWRVDHQGVDTHAIHFHLFNVQVINRVAIDGTLTAARPQRARLERDRAHEPAGRTSSSPYGRPSMALPWKLGDSVRLLEPSMKPATVHRRQRSSQSPTPCRTTAGSTCGTAICWATRRTT